MRPCKHGKKSSTAFKKYFLKIFDKWKEMLFIYFCIKIDFLGTCSYFLYANQNVHLSTHNQSKFVWRLNLVYILSSSNNLLLTEREGCTGEYWPEVVAVRTERSEVRTKTTEGQYSTVWLKQARLVSSLLYGTLSLIVKCTSGGLHLKMFVFSIKLWNFGKISIFWFSSDSFNVKNDIIHTFFSLFWLQILNLPASLQNINTRIGPFPWKRSVLQNPDRERTNQSTGICLRLGLPYNKHTYWPD